MYYVIKATYLDGPHKGKSCTLMKGGYVGATTEDEIENYTYWHDECYKTLGSCKAVCARLKKDNDFEVEYYQRHKDEKYALPYYPESFEPIEATNILYLFER